MSWSDKQCDKNLPNLFGPVKPWKLTRATPPASIFIRYVDLAADMIPHCSNLKRSQVDVFQALLIFN